VPYRLVGKKIGLRYTQHTLEGFYQSTRVASHIRSRLRGRHTTLKEHMPPNRALSPSSKLAIEQWAAEEVYLGDEAPLQVQHFYRAMDFLLEHAESLQKEVFWSTASLLNPWQARQAWIAVLSKHAA
jgi:hypothetical protein